MKKTVLTLVALTFLAGAAMAIEPSFPRNPKTFAKLDGDSNGKITLAEIAPRAEKRLLRLDNDGNGEVSAAEIDDSLRKLIERRRDRILKDMDTDRNGAVSRSELDKFLEAMFNGADADKDGGITLQEARDFRIAQWRKQRSEAAAD